MNWHRTRYSVIDTGFFLARAITCMGWAVFD